MYSPVANFLHCLYAKKLLKLLGSTQSYCNNNIAYFFLGHPIHQMYNSILLFAERYSSATATIVKLRCLEFMFVIFIYFLFI